MAEVNDSIVIDIPGALPYIFDDYLEFKKEFMKPRADLRIARLKLAANTLLNDYQNILHANKKMLLSDILDYEVEHGTINEIYMKDVKCIQHYTKEILDLMRKSYTCYQYLVAKFKSYGLYIWIHKGNQIVCKLINPVEYIPDDSWKRFEC